MDAWIVPDVIKEGHKGWVIGGEKDFKFFGRDKEGVVDKGGITILVLERVNLKEPDRFSLVKSINKGCTGHAGGGNVEGKLEFSIGRGMLWVTSLHPQLLHNVDDTFTMAWRGYKEDVEISIVHIRTYIYPDTPLAGSSYKGDCAPCAVKFRCLEVLGVEEEIIDEVCPFPIASD